MTETEAAPVSYEQWQAGAPVAGLPPFDGTGVPLPVDAGGWPVVPDGTLPQPHITAPVDGATDVDPLVDIVGTAGAVRAGQDVELWVTSSPGAAVATVVAAADGTFIFEGSTPLEVSPETLWVVTEDGEESPHITITVALTPPPEAADEGDEDTALDLGYDPGEHTVAEVQAYLEENPDQTGHVIERERAGKNRTTLIGD